MLETITRNKELLFGGVGVAVVSGGFMLIREIIRRNKDTPSITNQNIVTVATHPPTAINEIDINSLKGTTHILFIDDDQKFKVIDILKKSGWVYTKRTRDIGAVDDAQVQQADILFVDIQGVGKRLQFRDEGLGLASAIKDKYPDKKVVIYSAQTQGERFHDSFRKADDFIRKNADPYEFQQLTERLASELHKKP